jgi:lysozyme family protein
MTRLQGLPTFAKYGKGWTTRVNDLTFVANVLSDS